MIINKNARGIILIVTVTEIHRIKGLQKERVPVNIEVAPTIPKGALR
jgi:hypothetical protein